MTTPRMARPPQIHLSRTRVRVLVGLLVLVVLVVLLATIGTDVLVDLLFYREIHLTGVFTTQLITRVVLFVLGLVLGGAVVGVNVALARLLRPAQVPVTPEQQTLDAYRSAFAPAWRWFALVVGVIAGIAFGAFAQSRWTEVLLFLHGRSFGQRDPQFHRDLSYYAFDLPFERSLLQVAATAVFVSLVLAVLGHYLWGGVRLQTRGEKVAGGARRHLSVLLAAFLVLKAGLYWLDRYALLLTAQGQTGTTGAGYTDIHVRIPAKTILVAVALICALLVVANAVRRGWLLAVAGLGTMVFAALVVGVIVPALVQQFHVKPNAIALESPYVQRSITATRDAYRIAPSTAGGPVQTSTYQAPAAPAASAVTTSNANVANARLLDPNKLQPTFEQLQQIRAYYSFPQTLDIDRYGTGEGGAEQPYILATRDVNLAGLGAGQQSWVNEHLVYTHGQGLVAAEVGQVDANGRPVFAVGGLPETGADGGAAPISITQSRIYYGELSPRYSVVDTDQPEQDGTGAADYHYDGSGGVRVGSRLGDRLALAVHFRDYNLLFSSSVQARSRILYYRDPRTRVEKAAPWLTLDGDPYPAVVDGRVTWVVDGYTTSDQIPYSQRVSLGGTTATSQTGANVAGQSGRSINYIRNSVKATVDAYTGKVTLYAFENGTPDPVLRTWEAVFPHSVQPESSIPSALRAHLRYPEDLFTVQRSLLARYHVSDPKTFIQESDFWQVARDPVATGENQAPYYEELQMPGQSAPEFQLATSLTYNQRPNLAAFVAVSSDPGDYGTMRVLQLPQDTVLQGPANVFSSIKADPAFAQQFTLLNQNGSTFIPGNLLTLPVGGGLLFVQPYYVQAAGSGGGSSADSFPLLHYVVVDDGDTVGYAPTLAGAITAALSGGGAGTGSTPSTPSNPGSGGSGTGGTGGTVAALRAQVSADFTAAQQALAKGDLGAYQTAVAKAQSDYAKLLAAQGAQPSASPSASASP